MARQRHRRSAAARGILLAIAAVCFAAATGQRAGADEYAARDGGPSFLPPAPVEAWLRIDKLQEVMGRTPGTDGILVTGSINLPPGSANPLSDVVLAVGDWSVTFPAGTWARSGNSTKYTATAGTMKASINWWAGGSSKCAFIVMGKKQSLQGTIEDPSNVPVRLAIGGAFDKTATAALAARGRGLALVSTGPTPAMRIDKLMFRTNPVVLDRDSAYVTGRLLMGGYGDFNPSLKTISVTVGPLDFVIPAHTFESATTGSKTYETTLPNGGACKFTLVYGTNAFTIKIINADMFGLTRTIDIGMDITEALEITTLRYRFVMKQNGSATVFTYF